MPVKILMVEDHEPTRDLIRECLALDPSLLVVAETADGSQAAALAQRHLPDVVLMDLSLPGMNGLKATRQIKKLCPKTEVIILTNYTFADLKDRARESPEMIRAAAFLSKAEISTQLLGVIKSVMNRDWGK